MIRKKKTIKSRLFFYYFLLSAVFTISVLVFQNHREKRFRIAQLESHLDASCDLVNSYIVNKNLMSNGEFSRLDSLKAWIQAVKIRITVLNIGGKVLYDNSVTDYAGMENHMGRPEIEKAISKGNGYHVRHSATTDQVYFYFAKKYDQLIIRSAMVYTTEVKKYLQIEHAFYGYLLLLLVAFGLVLWLIVRQMGESVARLKEFTLKVSRDEDITPDTLFSDDELGIISREISRAYDQLRKAKTDLVLEKEKLFSHLFVLKEGVGFFSPQKKVILTNSHFIFYAKAISEESSVPVEDIFRLDAFREIFEFIDKTLTDNIVLFPNDFPRKEFSIHRSGYHFLAQCIFFQDKSFEILIIDNTQMVKRSVMKQQLTSNIAHELKTPISSIKGYLETVLNNKDLEAGRLHYFVDKAYKQSERLTLLVNDIALLNKIEESSELYSKEKVNAGKIIREVLDSFSDVLKNRPVRIEVNVDENVWVNVNYSLLFAVFRNLMENSLNYAGDGITISVTIYHKDNNYYYFSYADDGQGVEDEHLPRIFERFYRVDSGRSRKQGGTGLGLAIVKNAILSFKGEISVRKRAGGGLEFLFSLPIYK